MGLYVNDEEEFADRIFRMNGEEFAAMLMLAANEFDESGTGIDLMLREAAGRVRDAR